MPTPAVPAAEPTARLDAWLMAVRPKTLPAAVAPVLVGCAVSWAVGGFAWMPATAAFAVALLLQISANFANDVADFRRGADTAARLGPRRATQSGLISSGQMVAATGVVLALAAIPGLYLAWRGGLVFAAIGLLAMLSAVAYTAGPKPFGYLGLGELFVFVFFGPVAVAGTAYVVSLQPSTLAAATSVPMGCLVTSILVVNNLRDMETDRQADKRTLAVRFGVAGTRREFLALIALAFASPALMWWAGLTGPWPLISWVTLPLAVHLIRQVWTETGRALNPVLGATAQFCLWFAIGFSAGLVL